MNMNREELEKKYGQVWDTQELQKDFKVHSFLAPHITCTRKSDNRKGIMMFQHMPRFYFNFIGEDGLTDDNRELKRKIDAGEKVTIREVLGIKNDNDLKEWTKDFIKRNGLEGL
ncbi:hypothetical protein LCGC14_0225410 [marine sediment metagenome]|uniref:Uncharacterized protein n=1 Tax=marine sediment metagenome TaxID=412755 RepID=A0A0F9UU07_9ZZZZ